MIVRFPLEAYFPMHMCTLAPIDVCWKISCCNIVKFVYLYIYRYTYLCFVQEADGKDPHCVLAGQAPVLRDSPVMVSFLQRLLPPPPYIKTFRYFYPLPRTDKLHCNWNSCHVVMVTRAELWDLVAVVGLLAAPVTCDTIELSEVTVPVSEVTVK